MASQRYPGTNPQDCEYATLHGKRDFKLKISKGEIIMDYGSRLNIKGVLIRDRRRGKLQRRIKLVWRKQRWE